MGKGTVAKKRGGKGKGKADNSEKDILKEQLNSTGPFILRDFCRQHGMDPDDAKTFPKTKLISFLMGKFKDEELTLNDLYPDKEGGGKKSKAKSKAKEEPEDDDSGDDEDGAGDDDLDDDDLDLELDDDEGGDDDDEGGDDGDGDGDDDDLDLEDEANDELDDDLDGDDDDGDSDDGPDISIIEDKLDKVIDQNSKISKNLDLLVQLALETSETVRQGLKVLFKLGKVKNPGKLLGQIKSKAAKFAGIKDDDDDLEDE